MEFQKLYNNILKQHQLPGNQQQYNSVYLQFVQSNENVQDMSEDELYQTFIDNDKTIGSLVSALEKLIQVCAENRETAESVEESLVSVKTFILGKLQDAIMQAYQ